MMSEWFRNTMNLIEAAEVEIAEYVPILERARYVMHLALQGRHHTATEGMRSILPRLKSMLHALHARPDHSDTDPIFKACQDSESSIFHYLGDDGFGTQEDVNAMESAMAEILIAVQEK